MNTPAASGLQIIEGPIGIEECVRIGVDQNPRLRAAENRVRALSFRTEQEKALPDPMLNTTTYLAPVQTAAGEQDFAIGVSQKLTSADRRATRAAITVDEIHAAEAELADQVVEVAADIRSAYYQLAFLRESIDITREDFESLEQINSVVERQYEVDEAVTQQDVLNIQIELSDLENQIATQVQKEKSARARLARLMHAAPQSPFKLASPNASGNGASTNGSSAAPVFDLDSLVNTAIMTRPDLRSQLSAIRRDRKKIELAELEAMPDFTVGVNWIMTSTDGISGVANGDDAVTLGVGFNLPVRKSRIRAGVNEATYQSFATSSEYESSKDEVAEEIYDLVARAESTAETLSLVREDIVPKSERSLELSIEQYANGAVEYVQLIENFRTLQRFRLNEARLEFELQQIYAELNRAVGRFDSPETIGLAMPAARDSE